VREWEHALVSQSIADRLSLNPQQREALTRLDAPLRVVAGPGTGKTATVVGMYLHLVEERELKTSEVLLLTFANNAAAELKSRIDTIFRTSYDESWVSTFHSFATRVLTRYGRTRGVPPFRLMNGFQEKLLMRHVLEALRDRSESTGADRLEVLAPLLGSEALVQDTLWLIGILKQNLVRSDDFSAQAAASGSPKMRDLAAIYRAYWAVQDARRLWDFRDVIAQCHNLLRDDDELRSELSQKFRHVLVDEYQDVDAAQVRFLEMLTREHTPERRIAVVGDPNQAIYSFRGTLPAFIGDKWEWGGEIVRLVENYRSYGSLLTAADRLLDRYDLQAPRLEATRGEADIPLLRVRREQNATDEATAVVRQVHRLLDLRADGRKSYRPGDIAIILRSTRRSGRPFEEALRSAGIPHQAGAAPSYASSDVVHFGVNALQALADPQDDAPLREVLESPFCGVPAVDSRRLLEEAERRRQARAATVQKTSLLTVLTHTCYLIAEENPGRWPLPWSNQAEKEPEPATEPAGVVADPSSQLDTGPETPEWPGQPPTAELDRDGTLADELEAASAREGTPPPRTHRFYLRLTEEGKDAIHGFMRRWGLLRWLAGRVTVEALAYRVYQDLGVIGLVMAEATPDARREELLGPLRMMLSAITECTAFQRSLAGDEPALDTILPMLQQALPEYLDELEPPDARDSEGAVRLLTVHASKGLEFPVVFLPAMAGQMFPVMPRGRTALLTESDQGWIEAALPDFQPPWPKDNEAFLKEEARLGYVAATRARDLLLMSWADEYEDGEPATPSSFLSALVGLDPATKITAQDGLGDAMAKLGAPVVAYSERGRASTFLAVDPTTVDPQALDWQPWERHLNLPEEWWVSASSISNYLACPRKYYYSHMLRMSTDTGRAAARGTAFHEALAEFHNPETEATWYPNRDRAREVYSRVRNAAINSYLETVELKFEKNVERKALTTLFENYWNSEFEDEKGSPIPPRTLATERELNWRITEGLMAKGYIDRIVEWPNGAIEIIDYKTGKPYGGGDIRKKLGMGDEVTQDLQILIYLVAAREGAVVGLPDVRPEIVGLWFPKERAFKNSNTIRKTRIVVDAVAPAYPQKLDIIQLSSSELFAERARIEEVGEAIRAGDFPPTPRHEGYTCLSSWGPSGCDFAWICPGRIEEPEGYDPE
jgi:superfamily I DNA/RNA helicase